MEFADLKETLMLYNMAMVVEAIDHGLPAGLFQMANHLGHTVGDKDRTLWEILGDDLSCQLAMHPADWKSPWGISDICALLDAGPDRTALDKILCDIVEIGSTCYGDKSLLLLAELGFCLGRFERVCATSRLSDDLKEILIKPLGFWSDYVPNGYLMPTYKKLNPTAEIGEHSTMRQREAMVEFVEKILNATVDYKCTLAEKLNHQDHSQVASY